MRSHSPSESNGQPLRSGCFHLALLLIIFISVLYGTVLHYLPIGERDIVLDVGTLWQESSVNGDAEMYLAQVDDFDASMAPYRYRVLPTLLVRGIDSLFNVPPLAGYILLNCLSFVVVGVGFTFYLMRVHGLSYSTSLVGGLLAVTTSPLQSMMLLPMNEPISYVAALLVFAALHTRRPWVFAIACSLAILTKEVFVVYIPLYPLLMLYRHYYTPSRVYDDSPGIQG